MNFKDVGFLTWFSKSKLHNLKLTKFFDSAPEWAVLKSFVNSMKSIFNKLILIFFISLFCFFFFSLFFDYQLKTVVSGSMEPEISIGSLAVITSEDDPEVGEVITFERGNVLVTHRVISKTNGELITQGDANESPDKSPVDREDVIGRVSFSVPLIGFLVEFIQTPLGVTVLIFIGLVIILIEELKADEDG